MARTRRSAAASAASRTPRGSSSRGRTASSSRGSYAFEDTLEDLQASAAAAAEHEKRRYSFTDDELDELSEIEVHRQQRRRSVSPRTRRRRSRVEHFDGGEVDLSGSGGSGRGRVSFYTHSSDDDDDERMGGAAGSDEDDDEDTRQFLNSLVADEAEALHSADDEDTAAATGSRFASASASSSRRPHRHKSRRSKTLSGVSWLVYLAAPSPALGKVARMPFVTGFLYLFFNLFGTALLGLLLGTAIVSVWEYSGLYLPYPVQHAACVAELDLSRHLFAVFIAGALFAQLLSVNAAAGAGGKAAKKAASRKDDAPAHSHNVSTVLALAGAYALYEVAWTQCGNVFNVALDAVVVYGAAGLFAVMALFVLLSAITDENKAGSFVTMALQHAGLILSPVVFGYGMRRVLASVVTDNALLMLVQSADDIDHVQFIVGSLTTSLIIALVLAFNKKARHQLRRKFKV